MPLVPIFESLNDIDAATARREFKQYRAAHGEEVMQQGERSRGLVLVEEGTLEIVVDGSVVGHAHAGSMVGEMGLFIDQPRTATVRAPQGAVLWTLDREGYEHLRDTLHPICRAIELETIRGQVQRLIDVGTRVVTLGLGEPSNTRPPSGFFAAVQRLFGVGDLRRAEGEAHTGLGESALFRGAPWPAIQKLSEWFVPHTAPSGAFICTEGDVGDAMYILESGLVEVLVNVDGKPHEIATLEPGAAFGMVSLASARTRMSSCVAREPCRVLALDADGWNQLVNEPYMIGSTFRRAVVRAFSQQLQYSNAQLAGWEHDLSKGYGLEAVRQAQRGLTSHDDALFD